MIERLGYVHVDLIILVEINIGSDNGVVLSCNKSLLAPKLRKSITLGGDTRPQWVKWMRYTWLLHMKKD